jgi:hypothetical protein
MVLIQNTYSLMITIVTLPHPDVWIYYHRINNTGISPKQDHLPAIENQLIR